MARGLHQICKFTERLIFLQKRMDSGSFSFVSFRKRKGKIMTQQMYTIKEAARELGVEAHALRYWEEELGLTIGRNAQGRRVYTGENMQMFKDVMAWKEQGLQLKSIKELIHGKAADKELSGSRDELAGHRIIVYRPKEANDLMGAKQPMTEQPMTGQAVVGYDSAAVEKAEKARRLQELLKQFISESIRESNTELLQAMKEGLLKELDYQFRLQEEREIEREKVRIEMEDAHFKKLDENLRSAMERRGRKKKRVFGN